jgi:hypothetical protein
MRNVLVRLGAVLVALTLASPAFAQGGGGAGAGAGGMQMPKPEEIKKKAKEFLEKAPDATCELEGVLKITYKAVPTDPKKIAEALGKDLGAGAKAKQSDIEAGLKMYAPQIQEVLNDVCHEAGTFEALCDIKVKSKTIKKGSYKFGFAFEGERPVAIVLDPDAKKPINIQLVSKGGEEYPEVKIEAVQDKKKKEKFFLTVAFVRTLAKSPDCEAKPDKSTAKKDDKPADAPKPDDTKKE